MKIFITSCLILLGLLNCNLLQGQSLNFENAYNQYPQIPRGILEVVSWSNTHFNNINDAGQKSCVNMPLPYGVMGVFDNGANYFIENGKTIAQISGIPVEAQKANINLQILAYASAFSHIYQQNATLGKEKRLYNTFCELSEIPHDNLVNIYARDAQVYEYMNLLNNSDFASTHQFQAYQLDLTKSFGNSNLQVLSSSKVIVSTTAIQNNNGVTFISNNLMATKAGDYSGGIWNPAASCNYSSRSGTAISAITIHDTEGSYAGSISWFQNCSAQVSAHYVLRSSDGQITQMVLEANKAWHVGSENPYTIGLEHEGYMAQTGWYTTAMYNASAALVKDICNRQNISAKRVAYFPWSATTNYNTSSIPGTCVKIKGHQHFPNQTHTDPGPNWDWERYDNLINDDTPITNITTASGNIYDTGGATNDYGIDERSMWLIAPNDVSSVTLTFNSFETENTWDYLYIYDGATTNAPLIGKYTGTTSPGTITANSGKMLLLFKSDCATTKPGWNASFTSTPTTPVIPPDNIAPTTLINVPDDWKTQNFQANYNDTDNPGGSEIERALCHYGYLENGSWNANTNRGFLFDDFASLDTSWYERSGNWSVNGGKLQQTDISNSYSNIFRPLTQNLSPNYIYHWKETFSGNTTTRRGGLYIRCTDTTLHGGNSYFVWFRIDDQAIQFYKVQNSSFGSPLINVSYPFQPNVQYDFKLSFDGGKILIYVNNQLEASFVDATPMNAGNYVSFGSANTITTIDDFTVYRSRATSHTVNVGNTALGDFKTQNPDPNTRAGRILSLVVDSTHNLSTIDSKEFNVDWTAPENLIINDGISTDIDTTYTPTIEGNWLAIDSNSAIANYQVAIGTTAGNDDVVAWNTIGLTSSISQLLSSPIYNQIYYISVKATNGAGLVSDSTSDGQRYVNTTNILQSKSLSNVKIYPNPTSETLNFDFEENDLLINISDLKGKIILSKRITKLDKAIDVSRLSNGIYNVIILSGNQLELQKFVKE